VVKGVFDELAVLLEGFGGEGVFFFFERDSAAQKPDQAVAKPEFRSLKIE